MEPLVEVYGYQLSQSSHETLNCGGESLGRLDTLPH